MNNGWKSWFDHLFVTENENENWKLWPKDYIERMWDRNEKLAKFNNNKWKSVNKKKNPDDFSFSLNEEKLGQLRIDDDDAEKSLRDCFKWWGKWKAIFFFLQKKMVEKNRPISVIYFILKFIHFFVAADRYEIYRQSAYMYGNVFFEFFFLFQIHQSINQSF